MLTGFKPPTFRQFACNTTTWVDPGWYGGLMSVAFAKGAKDHAEAQERAKLAARQAAAKPLPGRPPQHIRGRR
jgi:hypothetical protein